MMTIAVNGGPLALLSRRGFLFRWWGVPVLASWAGLRPVAAKNIDTDGFLALSKTLLQRDDLDREAATGFLKGFLAIGDGAALHALAEGHAQPELEKRIITAWYTGLSPDPADPDAVTYSSALVWQAMAYTKALGICTDEPWNTAPMLHAQREGED